MAKEAYIEIDGKKTQLTVEQMKALGIYEEPKANANPFERVEKNEKFYFITDNGRVVLFTDYRGLSQNKLFNVANYCTDKKLMEQRALHETLNRLLWRFSMENDGSKINWNNIGQRKYLIYFDHESNNFSVTDFRFMKFDGSIYFYKKEIAQKAIDEIIRPFMRRNPDFIW